jgi:hypothetical protein
MANTTNYNWETPDDTDLVKDGAAAIRTLGSSIDTTTKNLNPETTLGDIAYRSATANTNTRLAIGSTGQVLTVAGGVPTWATSDDANAIQNAIVDAKGDIVAASAADTPARLAVGTDNQRLVAASGETTGLKYVSDTQNTVIDAEGDLLVGDAADALQRLAIGSNAQVLTVDTSLDGKIKWATPASGGGMTLISTTTFSSTAVLLSSISSSYNSLKLIIFGVSWNTANGIVSVEPNSSNANAYFGGQQNATNYNTSNGGMYLTGFNWLRTDTDNVVVINFDNYASSSSNKPFNFYGYCVNASGSASTSIFGGGIWKSTTAISSLNITAEGNTFTAGTALLYGVK